MLKKTRNKKMNMRICEKNLKKVVGRIFECYINK